MIIFLALALAIMLLATFGVASFVHSGDMNKIGYLGNALTDASKARLDLIANMAKDSDEHAAYVEQMKAENIRALARKEVTIAALTTERGALQISVARLSGALDSLKEHVKPTEDRLALIMGGHSFHIGGATDGHEGGKMILYQCRCGETLALPEGSIEVHASEWVDVKVRNG